MTPSLAYDPYIDAESTPLPPPKLVLVGTDPFGPGPEEIVVRPLSGAAILAFPTTAKWTTRVDVSGSASMLFTTSAPVTLPPSAGDLVSSASLGFTITAKWSARVALSGAVAVAISTPFPTRLFGDNELVGTSPLAFTSGPAAWTARVAMSGAASVAFTTPTPTRITGSNRLVGALSMAFTTSLGQATLTVRRSGIAPVAFTTGGKIKGGGRLRGVSSVVVTAQGTGAGTQPPPPPPPPPPEDGTGTVPRPASQIVDFCAICIHQNYPLYETLNRSSTRAYGWQDALIDLGAKHVRGLMGNQDGDIAMMAPLWDAGIKLCTPLYAHGGVALTGDPSITNPTGSYLKAKNNIDKVRNNPGLLQGTIAFEGLNEYNKDEATIPNWATLSRTFSKFIHDYSRQYSALNHVKMIPPSVYRRYLSAYQKLGDMSAWVNDGCGHYYTGVNMPTQGAVTMDQFVTYSRILTPSPTMKVFTTEHGFSNENGPNKIRKYMLRQWLEFLWRDKDFRRAYIFELIDTDPAPLWGLTDANMVKRPQYFSVQRFLALYKDTGAATLTPLPINVTAVTSANLKHLLHRKSDGSYLLALWREITSTETDAASVSVTVQLGTASVPRTPTSLVQHRPALDKAPVTIANNSTFTVLVSDEPSIMRMVM